MSNEFPKFSEVFALDKSVTYNEAVSQVWYPQDNAIVSVPSVSPIETVMLENNKIVPTVALLQISYNVVSDKILNFIDYSNLRDGAIIQLRIQDDTFPITIKNGIVGDGSIMTADGNDIILNDYRKIVQFQREGSVWRQVGGIQAQADLTQADSTLPDFVKGKEILVTSVNGVTPTNGNVDIDTFPDQAGNAGKFLTTNGTEPSWAEVVSTTITYWE